MLYLLDQENPDAPFPPVGSAEQEPNGLLAVGGDLEPVRLLNAYRSGIFPWYSQGQPILWWSPSPRLVLFPDKLRVSRSLRKSLRNKPFSVSFDRAFDDVIRACAVPRGGQDQSTWITEEMKLAYQTLHKLGYAHSVEVWNEEQLIGGLYGIAIGRVFFGESMFSRQPDGSKIGLVYLTRTLLEWQFELIDCQVHSAHLITLGAEEISRPRFIQLLNRHCALPGRCGSWDHACSALD